MVADIAEEGLASGGLSDMEYVLLKQKPIFGIDFYRKILAKNMWLKTSLSMCGG
jgi:hypothetical protein